MPTLNTLRTMFPHIGCIMTPEYGYKSCPNVYGQKTINGKKEHGGLSVHYSGKDADAVFLNILSVHYDLHGPAEVVETVEAIDIEDKEVSSHGGAGKIWVVNDQTADRSRVSEDEVQSYIDRGYRLGKKFAAYVGADKIAAVQAAKSADTATANTGMGKGKAAIGTVWVRHNDTKALQRVPADQLDSYLSNGYYRSGPRAA